MTDTPLPRLNAKRRDAEIHAPNGQPRSVLDVARYRTDPGFSCEARVELSAAATAGPRRFLLYHEVAGPRNPACQAALAGLVSCKPKLRDPREFMRAEPA